jgi:phage tail P2-like protein
MTNSLLPPNATAFERALEASAARILDVETPADIDDPATCPAYVLPWLAFGLSVDTWDADWTEADKRAAIADSMELHRRKGTRMSVEVVLARFDRLARLVEWHQATPRAAPHTFEILLPIASERAQPGGTRATAAFAEAIIREISRVKPLREHMRLVQTLDALASVGMQAVARPVAVDQSAYVATDDQSQPWDALLQTENGEPLQSEAGAFLDTSL